MLHTIEEANDSYQKMILFILRSSSFVFNILSCLN